MSAMLFREAVWEGGLLLFSLFSYEYHSHGCRLLTKQLRQRQLVMTRRHKNTAVKGVGTQLEIQYGHVLSFV